MSNDRSISSQCKGEVNANKLRTWIRNTPLTKVPLNHSGLSAKKTICETLSIPRSTIDSNEEIRNLFAKLDSRLTRTSSSERSQGPISLESQDTADYAPAHQLKRLIDENDALRSKLNRLQYLELTARFISDELER